MQLRLRALLAVAQTKKSPLFNQKTAGFISCGFFVVALI
jgi:hypothetical protein